MSHLYPLAEFTESLFLDARAVVAPWQPPSADDAQATSVLIGRVHAVAAANSPADAPELNIGSAMWGIMTMYWCSSVFVDRASVETSLPASLTLAEPDATKACQHWSVDLGLRFLPSLVQRSQRIAKDDALGVTLHAVAGRWPLSAVGTAAEIDHDRLNVIVADPCLRGLMVDRVLECPRANVGHWAEIPQLQPYTRQAIGAYPEFDRV